MKIATRSFYRRRGVLKAAVKTLQDKYCLTHSNMYYKLKKENGIPTDEFGLNF